MIKLLGVILFTMSLVGLFILYLTHSDIQSKKSLLKWIGFGTICFVVAALLLTTIVVLF